MKPLPFTKMHGAGNDFVVLDGVRRRLPAAEEFTVGARQEDQADRGVEQHEEGVHDQAEGAHLGVVGEQHRP